ncbi:MAG: hypothetical protein K5648_10065 [Erysipelotrichaceae bacterium]|nr:hypothetical protein [Erysipelotrichaceae bacterium]
MRKIEQEFFTYLEKLANGKGDLKLPADDFNVRDITVTNLINVNEKILYGDVHFLFGYDDGSEMFTTNLGYRFSYRNDEEVKKDLVYLSGNNYLFKDFRISEKSGIDNSPLYEYAVSNDRELVYLFTWAIDTEDSALFEKCCSDDVYIKRAGVNGDLYELKGKEGIEEFIRKDKAYYRDNMYSLVIEKENDEQLLAYHLYPANTGNKHLGSNTRYAQFFNEDITFTTKDHKITKADLRRKERPIIKRQQLIVL